MFKTNDLYDLFTLGSGDSPSNETGALFAGTGSEVKRLSKSKAKLNKKCKKKLNDSSSSGVCKSSLHTSSSVHLSSQSSCDPSIVSRYSETSCDPSVSGSSIKSSCDPSSNASSSKSSCDLSINSRSNNSSCDLGNVVSSSKSSCDPSSSSSKSKCKLKSLEEIRKAWQVKLFGDVSAQQEGSHTPNSSCDTDQVYHKSRKRKHSCASEPAIVGVRSNRVFCL